MFLSNERTLERKFKELYLSIKLTEKFDKKFLLELYLNKIFFG
jgi:penicillin-binding protein 1A